MRRRILMGLCVAVVQLARPAGSAAQDTQVPLSLRLPLLYAHAIDAENRQFGPSGESLFFGREVPLDTAFHVSGLLFSQLSSFPLASSSGGFTWTFEPATATFDRSSESFGPVFAERPITIGRNKWNIGVNVQHVTFDRLEGKALRGGEIRSYSALPEPAGATVRRFFEEELHLELNTDTVNSFATYGITDRLDVGVAVPINRVTMAATITSRFGNTALGTALNSRPPPVITADSGSAAGIGDVVVRAKHNPWRRGGGGLAYGVDVRLPTGDAANLLGAGAAQTKVYVAAAPPFRRVSPHVNAGYTFSAEGDGVEFFEGARGFFLGFGPPDEVNYVAGLDAALTLKATVAFDVVGRLLRDGGTLRQEPTAFGANYQEFRFATGDLNLLLGSSGVRFNPFGNLLVTANLLFPLNDRGLTDNLTWMVGVDYSF